MRPWLSDIVIIGGWAHRLHRLHPSAGDLACKPILTRDADVALPSALRLEGDIGAALKAAGFREEFSGDHSPPVSEYRLGDKDYGFHAEFLVPLMGSGVRRDGTADTMVTVAGVTAQKLRYLELLLIHPWRARLDAVAGFPLAPALEVQVANPTSFIIQKLLIRSNRPPAKQAQDTLYIHDTIEIFGRQLDELATIWTRHVKPAIHPGAQAILERVRVDQFSAITDTVREAARIPPDRALTPERVRAVCELGLRAIFSDS
jgi:hypothetical protein